MQNSKFDLISSTATGCYATKKGQREGRGLKIIFSSVKANEHENSTLKDMGLTCRNIAVFDMEYFNKKTFLDFTDSAISFFARNKMNGI